MPFSDDLFALIALHQLTNCSGVMEFSTVIVSGFINPIRELCAFCMPFMRGMRKSSIPNLHGIELSRDVFIEFLAIAVKFKATE